MPLWQRVVTLTDATERNQPHFATLWCVQVLGDRSHSPAVSAGPDLGVRPDVHQREHGHHGLPVHHLQLPAGHVHLHLPLHTAEEGEDADGTGGIGRRKCAR